MFAASERTVTCWAMGVTQHRNAVATVKEFVNRRARRYSRSARCRC
jgi:anaerobic selenocysteine-containing dehydrogenase